MIIEAEADEANQDKLQGLREFDEKMTLAKSFLKSARGAKLVVAGDQGKLLLDFFNDTLNNTGNRDF